MKKFYIPLLTATVIAGGFAFQSAYAYSPFWQVGNHNGDEFQSKLEARQNFMGIAQEEDMIQKQMHEQMQNQRQKRFQQMSEEDRIIQKQTDKRVNMMQENHKQFQNREYFQEHHHNKRGRHNFFMK